MAELLRDRLKNPDEARKKVDEMADRNPDNADAHIRRAHFLLRDRQPLTEKESLAEAEKACTRALVLQPENADALALASYCRQRNGDLVAAREYLRKSLAINPNVPQRYLQLAGLELDGLDLLTNREDRKARVDAAVDAVRLGIRAIPEKLETFELRWKLADLLIAKDKGQDEIAELEALLTDLKQFAGEIKKRANVDPKISAYFEARVAYLDARRLFVEGKWFEARQVLEANRNELVKEPDFLGRVDSLLARCYAQLGDQDLCLTASRRVLDNNLADKDARRQYAESLFAAGRLPEASNEYEQLVQMYGQAVPMPVDVFKQLVVLRFIAAVRQSDKQKEALEQLEQTLNAFERFSPKDPWKPQMRAEIFAQKGDFGAAENVLISACESQEMQNVQSLRMSLFEFALKQGDLAKAAERLTHLETSFGDSVDVRMAKARLLIKQKGKNGLSELAELANDVGKFTEPEQLQLYWQLAELCWSENDYPQGLGFGRRAANLAPNNLQLRLLLLQIGQLARDLETVQQVATEIETIEKGGAATLYSQAVCDFTEYLMDNKNTVALQRARGKLLQAQQMRPNWMPIPRLLGLTAVAQNDEDAALTYFSRAVELGTNDPKIVWAVAEMLQRRGRGAQAYEVIKKLDEQRAPLRRRSWQDSPVKFPIPRRTTSGPCEWRRFPSSPRQRNPRTSCGEACCSPPKSNSRKLKTVFVKPSIWTLPMMFPGWPLSIRW